MEVSQVHQNLNIPHHLDTKNPKTNCPKLFYALLLGPLPFRLWEIVETIERLRSKELYAFNEDASPAAYLGDIVWKAPDKVNPAHTIQEIVQNYAEWVC
ncbi:MAG: hypothetical protein GY845_08555 [Planctomycetes bacterium]|nr:hypothetical protein [Planctomycetota bacterium]